MVSFENFAQTIITMLKKDSRLEEGCEFEVMTSQKNNGVVRNSIDIREKGAMITPTIYIDEAYENYITGSETYESIVDGIVNCYLREKDKTPTFNVNVSNWDEVKDLICYKLINTESNEELLRTVPSIPCQDLSIVFYVIVKNISDSFGSILVRNKLAKIWEKNASELMEVAKVNTPRELPAELRTMKELLTEQGIPEFMLEGTPEMYILGNCEGHLGAGTILYPGVLDELLEESGDMVVLPSSIHETLLVPLEVMDESQNATFLSAMISEINGGELLPEEVLSDHPYIYTKKEQLQAMA